MNSIKNKQQQDLIIIFRMWLRLKGKLFPAECKGKDIQGIDLVILDSESASCISAFLAKGDLDTGQKDILLNCNNRLQIVNQDLVGYAGWYYRCLERIVIAILKYLDDYKLAEPL